MMAKNKDIILQVKDLHVAFGQVPVVHGLGFSIREGETLALVGESGSGKSVTSLAIMGLLPPQTGKVTGSITLQGRELLDLSERQMLGIRGRQIAMIFQEPMTSLNPVQRVGDQIGEAISLHRGLKGAALRQAVVEMLQKVRIPDAEARSRAYPHMLSGGQRQRVVIAMALACNPKLVIADEPTTALDVTVQAQILELLRQLQQETGTALLFITHDMGVVAEIADEVCVLRGGKMLERGEVHEIFTRPQQAYTKELLAAVPSLVGQGKTAEVALERVESPLSATTGQPVLEVKDLCVRFPVRAGMLARQVGNIHAVEGVSFTIEARETLGLVGESGSGKSTIGKAIINLVTPQKGEIRLDGHQIDYENRRDLANLRRKVQMIFQDPFGSLDARQSIGSSIMEPMIVHGLARGREAKEKMEHLLARVGLEPRRASSLPHEFSGGQRQRICIARALAMSPKLIIADEAVSALDVAIKGQILDLMLDLQQEFGLSYLFISHDMAAVEKICARVAVMYFGEIVEMGDKEQVIGQPLHDYTRKLLSAIPIAHPSARHEKAATLLEQEPPRSPFRPLGYEAAPALWARTQGEHYIRQE